MNKENLSEEQCVKWFQIHQYFWGITKLKAPTQVWRFNVPNGCGAGWLSVISLGTCTQRWILIKFKGSFKFSLEHLGCLWHLIPLWKSTKRWPRMSLKKILVRVSIIFLTQHIVQLGSGVLTCWTFLFWNTFVTMITSKVKTQFWSNQEKIF